MGINRTIFMTVSAIAAEALPASFTPDMAGLRGSVLSTILSVIESVRIQKTRPVQSNSDYLSIVEEKVT